MYTDEKKLGESQLDEVGCLLLKAADLLERNGWCQGIVKLGERRCAVGAIRSAAAGNCLEGTEGAAYSRLHRYLINNGNKKPISRWNDAPGRTQEEVVYAIRSAAYLQGEK